MRKTHAPTDRVLYDLVADVNMAAKLQHGAGAFHARTAKHLGVVAQKQLGGIAVAMDDGLVQRCEPVVVHTIHTTA